MINSNIEKRLALLLLIFNIYTAGAQDMEALDFKKPVRFSGSLNLQLEQYASNGIEGRKKPFSWMISGSPTVTVLGIAIPFSFLLSNFENRYYQPFNQYGISPKYKWITLHAGYRNVQFSPFTLAGYRMLGGGVELNPKHLRLGFMYGRLSKSTGIDSTQFANPLAFRPTATYTRIGYAGKVGVGSDKNYFDISFLKAWDKEASLEQKFMDSIAAAENIALGLSWKVTAFKNLTWQTDIGVSHYTSDIHGDKLALDTTYAKILRKLADIFDTRTSSTLLTAGETRLTYQARTWGLGIQYRRVDPEYQSMGAYFFQSDIEQYSVMPSARLLNGKLMLNGNIGFQRDNLYRQKLATSERMIANANINYVPSRVFGINFNYSNFGVTQNPLRTSPNDDIFKQVSQSYVVTPYLNLINERTINNWQLVASYQSLNSPVKTINTSPDQHTLFGTIVYSHSWLKPQLSLNASVNYNNTTLPAGDVGSFGGGFGAQVPLWEQRLMLAVNTTYNSNTSNGKANGYTMNGDAGITARFLKRNSVQVSFNYLKNESKDQTIIKSFNEKTVRVGYGISF